jgi:hypothetical protein
MPKVHIVKSFLAHKSCLEAQFFGFTEVSRCDPNDNSWCCAGSAGQGLGGPDCCTTNLTTSLEPYPFSSIDALAQTGAPGTISLFPTPATLQSSSISLSLASSFDSRSTLSAQAGAQPQPRDQRVRARPRQMGVIPEMLRTVDF